MTRGDLIIEGVTGMGKSSVVTALKRLDAADAPTIYVPEDETLGEFMDNELSNKALSVPEKLWRLAKVRDFVFSGAHCRVVLERFHLTYYALMPQWSHYELLDEELHRQGFGLVLLTVPDEMLASRTLFREDRAGTLWPKAMIDGFGGEQPAMEAIRQSQARRIEALSLSRLPHLVVDTSEMRWDTYAREIRAFSESLRR